MSPEQHGLTPTENVVMDLYDEGFSVAEIAARIGRKPGQVSNIISAYRFRDTDRFQDMAAKATAALLDAIRQYHPEYIR